MPQYRRVQFDTVGRFTLSTGKMLGRDVVIENDAIYTTEKKREIALLDADPNVERVFEEKEVEVSGKKRALDSDQE